MWQITVTGTVEKELQPELFCKISANMLVKQKGIFCAIYFTLARTYSIKVGRNFKLCALLELGAVLFDKLNDIFCAKCCVPAHLCFAPKGWWNWLLGFGGSGQRFHFFITVFPFFSLRLSSIGQLQQQQHQQQQQQQKQHLFFPVNLCLCFSPCVVLLIFLCENFIITFYPFFWRGNLCLLLSSKS